MCPPCMSASGGPGRSHMPVLGSMQDSHLFEDEVVVSSAQPSVAGDNHQEYILHRANIHQW